MNDNTIPWHRSLYDRLRGWGGLTLGLIIGAVAFGASTAGAGEGDLQVPGGQQQIKEECAEGCDQEEVNEWIWTGEAYLEEVLWAPPPSTTTPGRVVAQR